MYTIDIIKNKISLEEYDKITSGEPFIKGAIDIERGIIALGCEFHIECAEKLFEDGSVAKNVWGFNIYPKDKKLDFVALINIRPRENRFMEIQDMAIQERIKSIVDEFIPL